MPEFKCAVCGEEAILATIHIYFTKEGRQQEWSEPAWCLDHVKDSWPGIEVTALAPPESEGAPPA